MGRGSRVRPAHLGHAGQRVTRDRRVTRDYKGQKVTRVTRDYKGQKVTRVTRDYKGQKVTRVTREYLGPMALPSPTGVRGVPLLGTTHMML